MFDDDYQDTREWLVLWNIFCVLSRLEVIVSKSTNFDYHLAINQGRPTLHDFPFTTSILMRDLKCFFLCKTSNDLYHVSLIMVLKLPSKMTMVFGYLRHEIGLNCLFGDFHGPFIRQPWHQRLGRALSILKGDVFMILYIPYLVVYMDYIHLMGLMGF